MPTTFRIYVFDEYTIPSQDTPVSEIGDIFECELVPGCDARSTYYHWLHVARERAHERMREENDIGPFGSQRRSGYRIMLSIVGKEYLEYYCPPPPSVYVATRRGALIDRLTRLLDRANNPR